MSEDDRAFGYRSTKPARVVRVCMRVHDILDGLVRNCLLHFGNDAGCGHLALWRFNKDDVVLHLYSHTAIATGDHVNAIGELLGSDRRSGTASAATTAAGCATT